MQVLSSAFMLVPAIAIAAPGLSAINLMTTTDYYYSPLDYYYYYYYYFITSRDSDKAALDGSRRTHKASENGRPPDSSRHRC